MTQTERQVQRQRQHKDMKVSLFLDNAFFIWKHCKINFATLIDIFTKTYKISFTALRSRVNQG